MKTTMKKGTKRLLAWAMALVLCIGMLPVTAFAAGVSSGDIIGYCSFCGGNLIYEYYVDFAGFAKGYAYHCDKCGNSGTMDSLPSSPLPPNTPSNPEPNPDNKVCDKYGDHHEFTAYVFATETDRSIHMHYMACDCGYKGIVEYCSDGDSDGNCDMCGNSMSPKPIEEIEDLEGVRVAANCGGSFVWKNGVATDIQPGNECVADPHAWDVNTHDHQCDACHRSYTEDEWKVTETEQKADCFQGEIIVTKCFYDGCSIYSPVKTVGERLDPEFPETWTMVDEKQHSHVCKNCEGQAKDHLVYEPHEMSDWDTDWKAADTGYDYDPDTQTLWVKGRYCLKCEYTEYQYKVENKRSCIVDVIYQDEEGNVIGKGESVTVYEGKEVTVTAGTVDRYVLDDEPTKVAKYGDKEVIFTFKVIKYTLTIHYSYVGANGEEAPAFADFTGSYAEGEQYSVTSPAAPEGYRIEDGMDVVSGEMPAENEVWTVKYEPIPYTLTIQYFVPAENDRVLKTEVYPNILFKENYSYSVLDEVDGYKCIGDLNVEGTMPARDHTVQVPYEKIPTYTLTVRYVDEEGETLSTKIVGEYRENAPYEVSADATFGDYTLEGETAQTGTMPAGDHTVTFVYKANLHTLTINYVDEEGNPLSESVVLELKNGQSYDEASPVIAGYTTVDTSVTGTMGTEDVTVNVVYIRNTHTLTIRFVNDATGESISADVTSVVREGETYIAQAPNAIGAYTLTGSASTEGVMGTEDVTIIFRYSVPVIVTPEEPDVEVPDDNNEDTPPVVIINDEPTPLTNAPEAENDLVDIFEEDVPLADMPGTGNNSAWWYLIALLSGLGLFVLQVLERKARN